MSEEWRRTTNRGQDATLKQLDTIRSNGMGTPLEPPKRRGLCQRRLRDRVGTVVWGFGDSIVRYDGPVFWKLRTQEKESNTCGTGIRLVRSTDADMRGNRSAGDGGI